MPNPFALIGLIMSGIGSLVGAGTGIAGAVMQGRADRRNYEMQLKNYEMQQGLIDWNKHVQQTQWQREDTSVQRKVEDLRAAGLNPILAAGQGAPTSMQPIKNAPEAPHQEVNSVMKLNMIAEALGKFSEIAHTKAQNRLLYAQADKTVAEQALVERETEHYGYKEQQILSEINLGRMGIQISQDQLNLARDQYNLSERKAQFDQRIRNLDYQLRSRGLELDETHRQHLRELDQLDYALRREGHDRQERMAVLNEQMKRLDYEIKERDVLIEHMFGLRHGEQFGSGTRQLIDAFRAIIHQTSSPQATRRLERFWRDRGR